MTDLARPADVTMDRDELVATTYLVTFGQPTRRGYQSSLKTWFNWSRAFGISPLEAQRAHLELWMRELEEKGNRFAPHGPKPLMPATVNGMLNAVVGFYKFVHREGYLVDDITAYLKRPKVPNESRREGLTRFELSALLNTTRDSTASTAPLDHALVAVLACNGLRISEVCRLNADAVHEKDGWLVMWVDRSKGNRSADVLVIPMLSEALKRYLGSRREGPLFLKPRREERLDQKAANRIVHRVTRAAGIEKNITPHSFRHTHLTILMNEGMSERDIVNHMGYADARPLHRYDRDKANLARSGALVMGAALSGF